MASKFSPADPFAFVPHSLTCCYISYRRHFFSFFSRYSSTCIPLVKDVRYWQGHPGMKLIMIDPNLTRAKAKAEHRRFVFSSPPQARREGNLAPMTVHCQFIIWSNDRQGLGPSLTPLRHLPLWAMGNPEMMHGQWRRNNTTKCNTPRLKKQTRANFLSDNINQP